MSIDSGDYTYDHLFRLPAVPTAAGQPDLAQTIRAIDKRLTNIDRNLALIARRVELLEQQPTRTEAGTL